MALEGMDTGLAQTQAQQLLNQGVDAIQTLIGSLDSLVSQIQDNWKGPDATNFQGEWSGTHRPQLQNVLNALTEFHQTLTTNITQQIQASAS
jgi:uncharacterized protein YukE